MKVLIISDSHGNGDILTTIKSRHIEEVSAMIHCGDSELLSTCNEMEGFIAVRGNCDDDKTYSDERIEDIQGTRFYITHGHKHQVKTTLMPLKYRAEEMSAHVICFGHSHIAGAEMVDNKLYINPGSILLPRMTKNKTYAILEIWKEKYLVHYYNENGDLLNTFQFRNE